MIDFTSQSHGPTNVGEDPTKQNDGDERRIKNRRVLDNFERMRIVADGCGVEITADTVRLYPRWVEAPGNDLRLSLFPCLDSALGISYLQDDMEKPSADYPNAECLFTVPINIEDDFQVDNGSDDHSYPWAYWSAKTWKFQAHLLKEMP